MRAAPDYDLVVRGGDVVDGTGMPRYRADVGVRQGRIVRVGRIAERGADEIDAEGHVVTPGFIDGHTHMDAQVFWDPQGTSSCWHGVTTVVMGNCGLTLAPMGPDQQDLMIRNLEGVEDIPGEALAAGVPWGWEHYREYLGALERLPKAINYAGYVGHSALRTWAMGERAFEEAATEDDIGRMAAELRDALAAGAVGFTTSRSGNHAASDGRPIASRLAAWDEVVALVRTMAAAGGGIFEISHEPVIAAADPEVRGEYTARLLDLAVTTGVPMTFGVSGFGSVHRSEALLALIDDTAAAGGRMFGQSLPMAMTALHSFETRLPFDDLPEWRLFRQQPLADQAAALGGPDVRRRLLEAARTVPVDYNRLHVLERAIGENPTVADVAAARGADPLETLVDLALAKDLHLFFYVVHANDNDDEVRTIASHPRVVMTFTDSGAHVGSFIYSSMHTRVLADWVRGRGIFTLERAVSMLTLAPATAWNFADRGLVREGFVGDLNVLDPDTVGPEMVAAQADLPAGVTRLVERARGIRATAVGGEVTLRDGQPTGALPGRLLRRRAGLRGG